VSIRAIRVRYKQNTQNIQNKGKGFKSFAGFIQSKKKVEQSVFEKKSAESAKSACKGKADNKVCRFVARLL